MARGRGGEALRFFDPDEVVEAAPDQDQYPEEASVAARASGQRPSAAALQQRVEELSAHALAPSSDVEEVREPEPSEFEGETGEETLSIAGFYDRVRRALSFAFPGEVWVTGEIRGLKESRGHRYLELADHDAQASPRGATQQLEVICWAGEWPRVAAALASVGVRLEVGQVVRVRGRVSVWEGGSRLRFVLRAIDVEALLGGIAAARRRLLAALAAEGLLEANRRLPLCLVPLRIGVVTSPGSEAHRDFIGQLERSGFAFCVQLERSLVQGPEAPRQIAAALGRLERFGPDLAVVVRGGGGRGDLAAFDSEEVARAIAGAPFPVWTGIGHTGDRSVADEVAHRACITPTACGEAVVAVVAAYRDQVTRHAAELTRLARARLESAAQRLEGCEAAVGRGVRHQLARRADALDACREALGRGVVASLERDRVRLEATARDSAAATQRLLERLERDQLHDVQVLRAYDPRRQLERGWSLTHDAAGRLIRSVAGLEVGTRIRTRFADGSARSVVEETDVEDGPAPAHGVALGAEEEERA
ncbi:MAG: exodeoxyribonuclease VII large subunit [Actinomycetota bacterium]|nr:exodeoxyribonuclease VII large subunit [Actinomycetota bacterium]